MADDSKKRVDRIKASGLKEGGAGLECLDWANVDDIEIFGDKQAKLNRRFEVLVVPCNFAPVGYNETESDLKIDP